MGLITQLGLTPTAAMRGAKGKSPPSPPTASAGPKANAAANATSTPPPQRVAATSPEVPLGPSVEGPEFDRLYALMSADGSTPLDSSDSKGGAHDNEVGRALASAFGRVKKTEVTWYAQFDAVKQQATLSEKELAKMIAAQKAFSARADLQDDVSAESGDYVKAIRAVTEQVGEIESLVDDASAALDDVDVALSGKAVHKDEQDKEKAKDELEEAKEKAKEQQEMFKSALGLLGKIASPAEWSEIAVEGLMFVDEQLFAQLPKQKIEELKKRVEAATQSLAKHQGQLDASAISSAQKKLSAANKRLANGHTILRDRVKDLGLAQRRAVKKLATSAATVDVAKMIASSHKMKQLMAQAKQAGQHYLDESRPLLTQCRLVTNLFFGFPDAVKMTLGVDPVHARALTATARGNEKALKSWSAYLESMQEEAGDTIRACSDMSDNGFMKNYNQIEPVMQKMLSL